MHTTVVEHQWRMEDIKRCEKQDRKGVSYLSMQKVNFVKNVNFVQNVTFVNVVKAPVCVAFESQR